MLRVLIALCLAASPLTYAPPAAASQNMDKCVFFSWAHVSQTPSVFNYRLTNYCERRVYVQVCVANTQVCRGHYLNKSPRLVERKVQDPRKRGQRMTYRAIAN